ncbi:MAG: hypothetical protein U0V02_00460 [Anaerolineales bacterium]
MKIWKTIIRVWFTLASIATFLTGWVVLAHAPKPNQFNPADIPALPKLEPVPSLSQLMFAERSFNFNQSNQRVRILRSGGS